MLLLVHKESSSRARSRLKSENPCSQILHVLATQRGPLPALTWAPSPTLDSAKKERPPQTLTASPFFFKVSRRAGIVLGTQEVLNHCNPVQYAGYGDCYNHQQFGEDHQHGRLFCYCFPPPSSRLSYPELLPNFDDRNGGEPGPNDLPLRRSLKQKYGWGCDDSFDRFASELSSKMYRIFITE